jgi:tetratricopeptide (TPR) repeat protein
MNRLAWLYAKKKTKLSKAQRLSRKAVKSDPQNHRYLDTLAEVYYVRGKKDKAIKTIKKALEIDGDNRLYKQQLWRFKHIKATPKKVEAVVPAETTKPADAEPLDSEIVNTPFDTFGVEPQESNPEAGEPPSAVEEL